MNSKTQKEISCVHSLEYSANCAGEASQTDGGMPYELLGGFSLARSQSCSRDTPFLACEYKERKCETNVFRGQSVAVATVRPVSKFAWAKAKQVYLKKKFSIASSSSE